MAIVSSTVVRALLPARWAAYLDRAIPNGAGGDSLDTKAVARILERAQSSPADRRSINRVLGVLRAYDTLATLPVPDTLEDLSPVERFLLQRKDPAVNKSPTVASVFVGDNDRRPTETIDPATGVRHELDARLAERCSMPAGLVKILAREVDANQRGADWMRTDAARSVVAELERRGIQVMGRRSQAPDEGLSVFVVDRFTQGLQEAVIRQGMNRLCRVLVVSTEAIDPTTLCLVRNLGVHDPLERPDAPSKSTVMAPAGVATIETICQQVKAWGDERDAMVDAGLAHAGLAPTDELRAGLRQVVATLGGTSSCLVYGLNEEALALCLSDGIHSDVPVLASQMTSEPGERAAVIGCVELLSSEMQVRVREYLKDRARGQRNQHSPLTFTSNVDLLRLAEGGAFDLELAQILHKVAVHLPSAEPLLEQAASPAGDDLGAATTPPGPESEAKRRKQFESLPDAIRVIAMRGEPIEAKLEEYRLLASSLGLPVDESVEIEARRFWAEYNLEPARDEVAALVVGGEHFDVALDRFRTCERILGFGTTEPYRIDLEEVALRLRQRLDERVSHGDPFRAYLAELQRVEGQRGTPMTKVFEIGRLDRMHRARLVAYPDRIAEIQARGQDASPLLALLEESTAWAALTAPQGKV